MTSENKKIYNDIVRYDIKDILERIALPARSSTKNGFYDTTKLDEIAKLLEEANCPYKLIKQSKYAYVFGQQDIPYGKKTLLVSSHSDIVKSIKSPYSEVLEDKKYFKGTYDNLGTNGAAVYAMLNYNLPKNAYFAFTADEETGQCRGAEYALAYIRNRTGQDPYVIALDVTDEGYDHDRLFTIEGLNGQNESYRRGIAKAVMETEGNEQSCEFVRLEKKDDNSFLPKSYQSKNLTVYDESVFYAKCGLNSFSMCLPGDGEMHDDSGFYVKEPVMRGYADSLVSIMCKLTQSRQETIDVIKEKKDSYVREARDISFVKIKGSYDYYTPTSGRYFGSYAGESDEIEGQMDISDFIDISEQMEAGEGSSSYDELYDMVDELMSYNIYDEDEFKRFYKDMQDWYGIEPTDELEAFLKEVFDRYNEYMYGTEIE